MHDFKFISIIQLKNLLCNLKINDTWKLEFKINELIKRKDMKVEIEGKGTDFGCLNFPNDIY